MKRDHFTSEFPNLALSKGQGWLETVAMQGCLAIAECTHIKAARPTVDRLSGQHSGSRTREQSGIQMASGGGLPTVL